jgi:hypothetical protein
MAKKGLVPQKAKPPKTPGSTLYVPDAQRGIAVLGAAGSGKTFSVIDPLIRSSLDQGFPWCCMTSSIQLKLNGRLLMR